MKINEDVFLSKLSSLIDDPTLKTQAEQVIEKKNRERKLLEQFENALLTKKEEIEIIEQVTVQVAEELTELVQETKEEPVQEDLQPQAVLPVDYLATPSVQALAKTPPKDYEAMITRVRDGLQKDIDLIKKSIMDLHQFATGMSNMGGGGAGDVVTLDHPVILVTDDYTAGRRDYYIGVDAVSDGTKCCVTITLPYGNVKNGRKYVIKDEGGRCSQYNIKVVAANNGTIEGKTCPHYMQIDYMSLTFIYRNGWRII